MTSEKELRAMVNEYFVGLHQGDVDRLMPLFHEDCVLKAPGMRRSLDEWLANVSSRAIPEETGHPWEYGIIWVEQHGDQAMVKVNCPLPHGKFIDYLGFLREDGVWKIVNKMYAVDTGVTYASTEN